MVPPLGYGDCSLFVEPVDPSTPAADLLSTQPIVGEDHGPLHRGSLVWTALGMPAPLLVPALGLVLALGLRPSGTRYELALFDEVSKALVTRTWRSAYGNGEYELARPSVQGCDVLLRGDLFEKLQGLAGPLVWREHAVIIDRPPSDQRVRP
jgi:hypothetical protein